MKKIGLTFLLSLSLILLASSVSFADPSQLMFARAADNSLWYRTCTGTTCSAWTKISGTLAFDPTVVWDQRTARWYLYGIVSTGVIWRSTFDADGTFNNDWAIAGGSSSSPIIASSGGRDNNFVSTGVSGMTGMELTSTISNLRSLTIDAPYAGFVYLIGTGTIEHYRNSATGNSFARIYLTNTTGAGESEWIFTDVPSGTPTGYTSFPFGTSRWYSVTAGNNKSFFMTGEEGGGAAATTTTLVKAANLTAQFFPYSY